MVVEAIIQQAIMAPAHAPLHCLCYYQLPGEVLNASTQAEVWWQASHILRLGPNQAHALPPQWMVPGPQQYVALRP